MNNKTLFVIFAALPLLTGCWSKKETTAPAATEEVTPVETTQDETSENMDADHSEADHNENDEK